MNIQTYLESFLHIKDLSHVNAYKFVSNFECFKKYWKKIKMLFLTCRNYALPGTYRRLIILPKDLMWQSYMYSDVTKELTQSDLDLLQKKTEPVSDPGVLHVYFIVINTLHSKYWDNWNTIPINNKESVELDWFYLMFLISEWNSF